MLQKAGTFILTDSSLDKHSQRVELKGLDYSEFERNPVLFYNHHRSEKWTDFESKQIMPSGVWRNIREENDQLLADAYIDTSDETGRKLLSKIENGILRSTSIGAIPTAFSDDDSDKVTGQKGVTITKSKLIEASIVDIPSNGNAMRIDDAIMSKSIDDQEEFFQSNTYYASFTNAGMQNKKTSKNMFGFLNKFMGKSYSKEDFQDNAKQDEIYKQFEAQLEKSIASAFEKQTDSLVAKVVEKSKQEYTDTIEQGISDALAKIKKELPSADSVDELQRSLDTSIESLNSLKAKVEKQAKGADESSESLMGLDKQVKFINKTIADQFGIQLPSTSKMADGEDMERVLNGNSSSSISFTDEEWDKL